LFPTHGQPARPPWRLALVTLLQFAEGLSDRQAAHAVRSRIDWKHVLRLELTDPGFDASVLSEFRTRLIAGAAESLLFDTLLTWCRDRQLVNAGGRQRTDSTHILAAVRAINRIEVVGETMRHALNHLAIVAPEWLRTVIHPDWKDRYVRRAEDDWLPTTRPARTTLALTIGYDGWRLLSAIDHAAAPPWLRELPAVGILRRVWIQNYWWDGTQLHWRESDNIPSVERPHEEACAGNPPAGFCEGETHSGAWSNRVTLPRLKGGSNREYKPDPHTGGVLPTRPREPHRAAEKLHRSFLVVKSALPPELSRSRSDSNLCFINGVGSAVL
jgi:hypothetical protein